jgi:hypothetical protein
VQNQLTDNPDNGAVQDEITFKMPALKTAATGVSVGDWDSGGAIYLSYSTELFKQGNGWKDIDSIRQQPIVRGVDPNTPTTLTDILKDGKASAGIDSSTLASATNQQSLTTACRNLKDFLASFLIPDDRLVARFAILQGSPYETLPELRPNSDCFSDSEINQLNRWGFAFSTQDRTPRNSQAVNDRMSPITMDLLSQNPALIKRDVTDPIAKFYVSLGTSKMDFFQGADAISALSLKPVTLSCYQARPTKNLSSIAAIADYNGSKTGAIVAFDNAGKLASLTLRAPDKVSSAMGLNHNLASNQKAWPDQTKASCNLTEAAAETSPAPEAKPSTTVSAEPPTATPETPTPTPTATPGTPTPTPTATPGTPTPTPSRRRR